MVMANLKVRSNPIESLEKLGTFTSRVVKAVMAAFFL